MPDGKVTIAITADASGVEKGAKQAEQSLTGIEKKASSGLGFGIMAGIGSKAFELVTGAASKAVQMIGQAVGVGSKFESQMSKVAAISKASASDMALLTDKAKELGSAEAFSASQAGQAMEYMAMAGWKTSDMLNGIEGIMNLAVASGEDLAKTSDIVTDALTAFGLKAKDSGRFADVLAAASSNANTDVSMLGESFKQVAPVAGALGYSVEDVSTALGLMANAGIKGGSAGTALRATLSRLSRPTKETKDAMEKLGVSLTDEEGNLLSLREIMLNMRSGFAALSEGERSAAAAMLGGQEAMSGLLAIVNASDDDFENLTRAIDNSNGAAKDMADTVQDNLEGSLTKFGSAAEGLGIAVYDAIKGPLTGLVDFGTAVISGITGLLTKEQTELDRFMDQVEERAQKAEALLQSSYDADALGEDKIGKLAAYEKVLLRVAEAGKANEFQAYQMETILADIGDEIPEIAAAWDSETRSLNINADAIKKNMDERKKIARLSAITEAQEKAEAALGEYEMERVMLESALESALEKTNETIRERNKLHAQNGQEMEAEVKSADDLIARWTEFGDVGDDVVNVAYKYNDSIGLIDQKTKETEDRLGDLATAEERTRAQLEQTTDAAKDTADAIGEIGNTVEDVQAVAEATENLNEAAQRMSDSYTTASETVGKAFDTIKKDLESAFSVSMFDSWNEANQKGAWDMINALEEQEQALKRYKDNMAKLQENLKGEEGADDFLKWLSDAGTAGARTVAELAGNAELAKRAVQEYAEAFDASDAVKNALAQTNAALLLSLNELGSTAEEWDGLEDIITAKVTMSGVDAAIADALESAAETAREMGVAIPQGLAESIMSSDDPATAIADATEALNSAILGHAERVISECEKLGLDVPQSIKSGIESGGADAKKAYDDLIALMGGTEAMQKARDAGKQGGEKATEGQAEGVKAKEKDVVEASQQNARAGAEAVRGEKYNMAAAGKEFSESGAGGVMSSILAWSEAGTNVARGFAQGIRNGKSEAVNAAVELSAAAVTAAKNYNEIQSPSHLYRDKIGYMNAKGWAVGMLNGTALVTNAAKTLGNAAFGEAQLAVKKIDATFDKMEGTLKRGAAKGQFASSFETASTKASAVIESSTQKAEDTLKKAATQYFTGLSDANTAKLEELQAQQDKIREQYNATQDKTLRESLNAQEKALKAEIDGLKKRQTKISKLSGEFASSVLAAYGSALDTQADKITTKLNNALEKAADTAQTKIDTLNNIIASMRSGLLDIGSVWDGATFGKGLLVNVKDQIAQIQNYETQLKALGERGVSKTLLAEIESMDAETASGYMSALLGLSEKDLKEYDKLFRKRAKEAKRISDEYYAAEVQDVKDNYLGEIKKAFSDAEESIASMGAKAMQGFLKGMKSSDYSREIRKIAKNIVKSMADELEIHSPSRKAWELGSLFSMGFTNAIAQSTAKTESAMERYANESLAAFRDALGMTGGMKASFAAPDIRKTALPMSMSAAAPELATVPAAATGGRDYTITLITTLDGREIARGTAQYTEAELAKRQTIQARREGYL